MKEHVYDFTNTSMSAVRIWVLTNPHGQKLNKQSEMLEIGVSDFLSNLESRKFAFTQGFDGDDSQKWELVSYEKFTPSNGSLEALITLNYRFIGHLASE